jgi:hypothetical protein
MRDNMTNTSVEELLNRAIRADPRIAATWIPAPYTQIEKDKLKLEGAIRTIELMDAIEVWSGVCQCCDKSSLLWSGPAEQYVDYVLSTLGRYEIIDRILH